MKRVFIVLLLVTLFFSCHKLESGIVVKKYYVVAHHEQYTILIYSGKTLVPVINTKFVPDKWYITIEGEYRGKIRREDFSITESEYININTGDFIRVNKIREN